MKQLGIGAKIIFPVPQDDFTRDLVIALKDTFGEVDENLKFLTRPNIVSTTGDYTIQDNDYTVVGTSGITVTLPSASPSENRVVYVKNIGASTMTISAQSGEVIDGSNTFNLANQYDAVKLQSDGSGWHILSTK